LHAAVNDTSAERALPIVRSLLARGEVSTTQDDNGFDAIHWGRQEVWAPNDEVIALLGGTAVRSAPAGPDAVGDYPATAARVRSIEARSGRDV
jgi:hypothetical protein